ncbi:hypothetical protein [Janthinobacterium sp. JC611]|uniref:hypothetical protein n=1 Tax=Janthinobacterium sp. JC611 TaxID=2816201 RepID=UPI001BFD824D|nr:hypothetical protein [Janthinobacterium sp. JC611]
MTTLTAAETYLQDFHQRQVGVTRAAFAHLPASSPASTWTSSDDMLTSLIPASDTPLSVLDLACAWCARVPPESASASARAVATARPHRRYNRPRLLLHPGTT